MASITEFDPLSPEMLENPYLVYAKLQESFPVSWHDGLGAWVVTRYDDCRRMLMDSETFVRDPRRVGQASTQSEASVQSLTAERQIDLRRVIVGSVHSQDFDRIGREVRTTIDGILDDVADADSFDWMQDVGAPLAGTVTSELLGVRAPDPRVFKAIAEGMARRFDTDLGSSDQAGADQTTQAFGALIDGWLGAEDTHGTMLTLKERSAELGIPLAVVKNSIGLLFIGSYGTIFAASGSLAHLVVDRPDVLDRTRDPALLAPAVDEFLRFDGPTHATSRVALQETRVGEVTIGAGEPVFLLLAAANRDPAQFPNPQEMVLDRTPNKHLAFGWGPHSCLGSLFGQLALQQLVSALHDRPPLRLTGGAVRLPTATVRGFAALPMAFGT